MGITIREQLTQEDFFDFAIIRLGFAAYMRAYEIIIGGRNGQPNTDFYKYQFAGCFEAQYTTKLSGKNFSQSLSDEFVYAGPGYPENDDPGDFIWGVRFSNAYQGLT